MGAPSGHVFEIKATIGRKRVNPIDEGEYHARKSMRCQGESQTHYLVVCGWVDARGNPHPPEWQPAVALAHGDPEADLQDFIDANHGTHGGTLPSNLPNVGRYVDVRLPESEDMDIEQIPCEVCQEVGTHPQNDMVGCDGCDKLFHQQCLRPALSTIPDGKWFCRECETSPGTKPDRKRRLGLLYANKDKQNQQYPYVVKFPDTSLRPILTDMKGNNKVQGGNLHESGNI